ncbi:MAG: redoxin domain-containing protein [Streptosporangiales bacterium]|nr:redoxin domain-containing protein [Streptosporangiales bacterium]
MAAVGVVWAVERDWTGKPGDSAVPDVSESDVVTGVTVFEVGNRPVAPAVAGDTLDGGRLALAELRGHVVVVNVWGSWCVPCQEEAPQLARVARETHDDGVRFVGIDVKDDRASARAFVRRFAIPYPSIADPDGKVLLAFDGIIPVSAVPSTLVLDRDGRVAARVVGQITYRQLRGLVDDVAAERGSRPSRPTRKGAG